jgi:hypothetical protein
MKKMRVINWIPFAGMTLAIGLAGCESIGDGSTLQSLRIVPANTTTQTRPYEDGGTYKLFQCLRDEFLLTGTFTDGNVANFNARATWTSSDESVVRVSNGDIPATVVSSGSFVDSAFQTYVPGTMIPVGNVGDTATITATFLGLSASINVVIHKPELKIIPAPFLEMAGNPLGYTGPASLGTGTRQQFSLVGSFDGRIQYGAEITGSRTDSSLALNALLWKFSNGVFQAADEDDATTLDNQWVVPNLAAPEASINAAGVVRGIADGGGTYPIEAQLSLCSASSDPVLKPATTVQVLPFASTNPLTLDYEANFHNPGSFAPPAQFAQTGQVVGTNQILRVAGHLDSDNDGDADVTQYLGNQVAYDFEPRDGGVLTLSSLFSISGGDVLTASAGTTGRLNDGFDPVCLTAPADPECVEATDPTPDEVSLEACFPLCAPRLATLEAENPLTGPVVTLTATGIGITAAQYVFDCGDGDGPFSNGAVATADCDYTNDTGPFTATVRILDANDAVSVNTGAVQIDLGTAPATNTAPTAALTVLPTTGTAPVAVAFSASASRDSDSGDSVKVYEFHPDAGVVVRQNSSTLIWVYLSTPGITPFVRVYDSFGVPSTNAEVATLTITGTAAPLLRSARLPVTAQPATPCALEIVPPLATTETAFTFPGLTYEAVASFIATESDGTQDCAADPLIGTQKVTRFLNWFARPAADSAEFSDLVRLRNSRSDFERSGQVFYLRNPDVSTDVAITAAPVAGTIFASVEAPAASTLTVEMCPTATCPP